MITPQRAIPMHEAKAGMEKGKMHGGKKGKRKKKSAFKSRKKY